MPVATALVAAAAAVLVSILSISPVFTAVNSIDNLHHHRPLRNTSLCAQLIQPSGYPCSKHTVQTKDGHLLALQHVSSASGSTSTWAVYGTRWSHRHVSLSEKDKDYWDWSWEELALYDLAEMINYGTIMALAAFTQPRIVKMVGAATLLSPILYLEHITAWLVLWMVSMHLDQDDDISSQHPLKKAKKLKTSREKEKKKMNNNGDLAASLRSVSLNFGNFFQDINMNLATMANIWSCAKEKEQCAEKKGTTAK